MFEHSLCDSCDKNPWKWLFCTLPFHKSGDCLFYIEYWPRPWYSDFQVYEMTTCLKICEEKGWKYLFGKSYGFTTLVPNPHNSNLELRLKLFGLPTWVGTKPTCEKRSTIMIHASEVGLKIKI